MRLIVARVALASLTFTAVSAATVSARAQTHVVEAGLAVTSASARDDLLVPLASTGGGLGLLGRYRLEIGSERVEAELALGAAVMFDRFDRPAVQLPYSFALAYAHVVQRSPLTMTQLGATLRWQTELSYFEAWDDAHGYWLAMIALGPNVRHAYSVLRTLTLETRAELALFGVASRPPSYRWNKQDPLTHAEYYVDRIQDGELVWLWDVQALSIEALGRAREADAIYGTGFGAGAFARLARASGPAPYAALYLGILLDYGWQL
jgi:hypothetical protein